MTRPTFNLTVVSENPETAYIEWEKPNIAYNICDYEILFIKDDANNQNQSINSYNISDVGSSSSITIIYMITT